MTFCGIFNVFLFLPLPLGWWMIVTDEEQGYAPAAYLESIDKTYDSLEPEVSSNEGKRGL